MTDATDYCSTLTLEARSDTPPLATTAEAIETSSLPVAHTRLPLRCPPRLHCPVGRPRNSHRLSLPRRSCFERSRMPCAVSVIGFDFSFICEIISRLYNFTNI